MMFPLGACFRSCWFCSVVILGSVCASAGAETLSYASILKEVVAISEDSASVALGPPDYLYTDGAFAAGTAITFAFPALLDDVPGDDLLLYIFVTGRGTKSSTVKVEARAASALPFVELGTIITGDLRSDPSNPFATFDHVHHFGIDFAGRVEKVSEVRIKNIAGDDLKLDALEGIHPAIKAPPHAVEMRIFRLRDDYSKRFQLRFKNLASLETGVAMSGFMVQHANDAWIDQTDMPIVATDGQFVATPGTTAGPDNGPRTQLTEYVWQGSGEGMQPGGVASHSGSATIDTDVPGDEFLENFSFTVFFVDGVSLTADWDEIAQAVASGQLFALYGHPASISEARPAHFYEFVSGPVVPEDICIDCARDTYFVGPLGPQDENRDDNTGSDPALSPQPVASLCGAGALGFIAFSLIALMLARATGAQALSRRHRRVGCSRGS